MKAPWLLLCTLLSVATATADEGDNPDTCPTFPKGSDFTWKHIQNIDSGYCIGKDSRTHKYAFVYGVMRFYGKVLPEAFEPESSFVRTGNIVGIPIRWYEAKRYKGPRKFKYRAIGLSDEDNQIYLDVAVYADSERELVHRMQIAEQLKWPKLSP
jgi:hypothetical protein